MITFKIGNIKYSIKYHPLFKNLFLITMEDDRYISCYAVNIFEIDSFNLPKEAIDKFTEYGKKLQKLKIFT